MSYRLRRLNADLLRNSLSTHEFHVTSPDRPAEVVINLRGGLMDQSINLEEQLPGRVPDDITFPRRCEVDRRRQVGFLHQHQQ